MNVAEYDDRILYVKYYMMGLLLKNTSHVLNFKTIVPCRSIHVSFYNIIVYPSLFQVTQSCFMTMFLYSNSHFVHITSYDLHFPSNLEDLKSLASLIKQYRKDNFSYVVLLFCSAYLYKQTFAIPGSVLMVCAL